MKKYALLSLALPLSLVAAQADAGPVQFPARAIPIASPESQKIAKDEIKNMDRVTAVHRDAVYGELGALSLEQLSNLSPSSGKIRTTADGGVSVTVTPVVATPSPAPDRYAVHMPVSTAATASEITIPGAVGVAATARSSGGIVASLASSATGGGRGSGDDSDGLPIFAGASPPIPLVGDEFDLGASSSFMVFGSSVQAGDVAPAAEGQLAMQSSFIVSFASASMSMAMPSAPSSAGNAMPANMPVYTPKVPVTAPKVQQPAVQNMPSPTFNISTQPVIQNVPSASFNNVLSQQNASAKTASNISVK